MFRQYCRLWAMLPALAFLAMVLGTSFAQTRHFQPQRSAQAACQCGRWTCPVCQQHLLCPPTGPALPFSEEFPSTPEGGPKTETEAPPNISDLPTPLDMGDLGQDISAGTDTSSLFASNRAAASGGAFGSSLIGATTPEMMGDFFGPGALPSIVAQSFPINTSNVASVGGGILALELDGDLPPNDFFSLGPPTTNGDGSQTIALGAPTDPNDVPQPAGSGYSYLSGYATLGPNNSADWVGQYSYGKPVLVPGGGYVLGRLKIAENYSPIPRDRVFFNYSLFHNVPLTSNGVSVNRFTPGFEKTFLGGMVSLELRTPFAATLSSDILADGGADLQHVEFGNLFFALKGLLIERRNWVMVGGLSVTAPTADDTKVLSGNGTELLRVENQSVHIMPFMGLAYAPNRRFFALGSMQLDVDTNGNTVLANRGNALGSIGRLHDMTYLYLDASAGWWIRNAPRDRSRLITGIAPIVELHINRSLTEADVATDGISIVRNPVQEFDTANVLGGLILNLRSKSRIAFGYATPIGNGSDRAFDGELRVTLNRYF